jgi:hypothetical protein
MDAADRGRVRGAVLVVPTPYSAGARNATDRAGKVHMKRWFNRLGRAIDVPIIWLLTVIGRRFS